MPKNIEDMIPSERRRSIRDIPIPDKRRRMTDQEPAPVRKTAKKVPEPILPRLEQEKIKDDEPVIHDYSRKRRGSRKGVWSLVAAAFLILGFAVMSIFTGATLAYTPKSADLKFNKESFNAYKTGEGELLFSVVKLSGEKGVQASASGEEEVERKASGTIVVYNSASAEPQRLVTNTRFEAPDGKIYRINKDITIPGRKTVGGTTQPGSIEVQVFADQAGPAYNIGLVDFTVPGLKGTPRYTTIYARSKTAMTGGFIGRMKTVSEENLATAKAKLESDLNKELLEQVKAQVPEDFILFPNLSSVVYEDLPQSNVTDNGVTVNMRGNFYGVMFKKSDLARFLTAKKTVVAQGENVDIPDIESLNLAFAGTAPADLLKVNQINFTVEGQVQALWTTDESRLKADLAGKNKKDISSILKNYPSVAQADAIIRPFWKSDFPEDPKRITVKKLTPQ